LHLLISVKVLHIQSVNIKVTDALLHFVFTTDELVSRNYKDVPNYHYLSRSQRYGESIRKTALFLKLMKENSLDEETKHFVMS